MENSEFKHESTSMRTIPEWIADHDDQAIPARVKVRIFAKFNGRCSDCTLKIVGKLHPAYDHIIALVNGGEHRESNLQLLCVPCHAGKTKSDLAEKSRVARKRMKHLGLRGKRRTIPGRKFDGTPIPSRWVNS